MEADEIAPASRLSPSGRTTKRPVDLSARYVKDMVQLVGPPSDSDSALAY